MVGTNNLKRVQKELKFTLQTAIISFIWPADRTVLIWLGHIYPPGASGGDLQIAQWIAAQSTAA